MKRLIKAADNNDVILSSEYFDLVSRSGTGMGNVPWSSYEIYSKGLAEDLIVRIDLNNQNIDFNSWKEGEPPLKYIPYSICINWGFSSQGDPDVIGMITVLQEAMKFGNEVAEHFGIKTINF